MKIRFRCEIPVYKKLSFTDSGQIYNTAIGAKALNNERPLK